VDKDTRNAIERATQRARRLLEEDFAAQLEGTFDVLRSGVVAAGPGDHLRGPDRSRRKTIVAAVQHKLNAGMKAPEAVADYLRDAAFTALNRFVALKMLEARGLVQECVSKGDLSAGYKEFCGMAEGLKLLPDGAGYRLYIESLFDELSTEVKVLFDRRDPASVLWPRRQAFDDLLGLLNGPELAGVWGADETIGWVYQFFNSGEERRAMRDASQAPRNSRELAVRNQFFTPRYVVQFLTDNTLGRTWYQMRLGETGLRDKCEYLVRSADEVFLGKLEGDEVAAAVKWLESGEGPEPDLWTLAHTVNAYDRRGGAGAGSNAFVEAMLPRVTAATVDELTVQEAIDLLFLFCRKERFCEGTLEALTEEIRLLRESVARKVAKNGGVSCVRPRALKDPRDIKILDPACGSGHFLLYAFDLLLAMYEEAAVAQEAAQDKSAWPASEVSGKPLWMDYDVTSVRKLAPVLILEHNLHGVDIDPRCAQIAALALWMRAQRAFHEAGIAKADRPRIRKTNIVVAEPIPGDEGLRREFAAGLGDPDLARLFDELVERMKLAGDMGLLLRVEDLVKTKWKVGETRNMFAPPEERIRGALQKFVEGAAQEAKRRLFRDDALAGLGLIEVASKKYDVVLMNPPFGLGSLVAKKVLEKAYARTKNDLYAAFVERGIQLLHQRGMLGALTSRTGFFLSTFQAWREEVLLKQAPPIVFADLGAGVLDSAMVEVAAYCLESVA
jgi:23S rRNA G2445 N2-methylase RlmL